jgi:coproporphyrinogen III oxidase-like Fe-S oxidoreductase
MNKKQIRAIETLKAAADNARKVGLTEHQIDLIMKPDVNFDRSLEDRKRALATRPPEMTEY